MYSIQHLRGVVDRGIFSFFFSFIKKMAIVEVIQKKKHIVKVTM